MQESTSKFNFKVYGDNYYLDIVKNQGDYISYEDIAKYVGIDNELLINIVTKHNGEIFEVERTNYVVIDNETITDIEVCSFKSIEDIEKCIAELDFERQVSYVYRKVKSLEKKYKTEEPRSREDIRLCYKDEYILCIWESEKYTEESGEGFSTFENFLIDFIEENLIFE